MSFNKKNNGKIAFIVKLIRFFFFTLPAVCFEPSKSLTFRSRQKNGYEFQTFFFFLAQTSAINEDEQMFCFG